MVRRGEKNTFWKKKIPGKELENGFADKFLKKESISVTPTITLLFFVINKCKTFDFFQKVFKKK